MIKFPTRQDLINRIKADFQGNLLASNPFLRNSWIGALITAVAGRFFDINYQLNILVNNLFPFDADEEYLNWWAVLRKKTKNLSTQSTGYITVSGNALNLVPIGTEYTTSDGISVITQANATISDQTIQVESITRNGTTATITTVSNHNLGNDVSVVIAGAGQSEYNGTFTIVVTGLKTFQYTIVGEPVSPATGSITASFTTTSVLVQSVNYGKNNNIAAGSKLIIKTPIEGVNNEAVVQFGEIAGGMDDESIDSYRERVVEAWQNPATPFNVFGITEQAEKINGVTKVWVQECIPSVGCVTIYFIRGNDENIIPSASEVESVKNKILEIKPANTELVDVIVNAPTPNPIDFVFSSLTPNNTAMQEAVRNSLKALFQESVEIEQNLTTYAYENAIWNAYDALSGQKVEDFTLSSPTGNVSNGTGELPILGDITFNG